MKGLLIFLGGYWFVCFLLGASMFLTGCFSAGGRVYLGYEVQDEIKTTAITHPNQMSITDRLWKWATTPSVEAEKDGEA